jgi:hypothetical protein
MIGDSAYREASLSAAEVQAALRSLVEQGARATVCAPGSRAELVALALDFSAGDAGEVRWRRHGSLPPVPFAIRAVGRHAVYELPVTSASILGDVLVTACPESFQRVRARSVRRAAASAGLVVTFDGPDSVRHVRSVFDLSHGGLSFCARGDEELPATQRVIDRLFVEQPSGESIELTATVACRRLFVATGELGFGCRVVPASAGDAARWLRLCDEHLFAATRRGAADVWDVYRTSGYFALAETVAGSFEPLRAAYRRGVRALQGAPQLGCQASWPARGEPRATVTNLLMYPDCWLSFHLAAQPDQSLATRTGEVLRALYEHHLEHALAAGKPRLQMAYVQQSSHWSRRVHVDFIRRYVASGEALIHDFRAFELRTTGPAFHMAREPADGSCVRRQAVCVHVGTALDVRAQMPRLRQQLPELYRKALGYDADDFPLTELCSEFARHGLERARDLLVATCDDEVLAVGVVDAAEPGLHLFGLLDTVRLYALAADGRGTRAFPALLDAARAWFRARERRTFCYFEEQHPLEPDGNQVKLLGDAYLTLIATERLPEQIEAVYCETAEVA